MRKERNSMPTDQERYHANLHNIGALDGREILFTAELRKYLSEAALHRFRAVVEIENLIALSESDLKHRPKIPPKIKRQLRSLVNEGFDSSAVSDYDHFGRKDIKPTEHDIKSVELYLRELLTAHGLDKLCEFIHLPATSEDINNIAYNLSLRESINQAWLPMLLQLSGQLSTLSQKYSMVPVIGKTHGMSASPTTIGKRFAYFLDKLNDSSKALMRLKLKAKFSGPVGNHNAMHLLVPDFDMQAYSKKFVESFGLEYSSAENQRISHQSIVRLFHEISIINTIILDLCTNIRHSIMMGWLYIAKTESHVGSSVMPHKINPWFFEVAEGYFEISNKLIEGAAQNLISSVFERDLTDHPWERCYGNIIGASLTGLTYCAQGMEIVRVDEANCSKDLASSPEVLSEAIQIGGRLLRIDDIYMKIKKATRGESLSIADMKEIIRKELPASEIKNRLLKSDVLTYTGIAKEIAQDTAKEYNQLKVKLNKGILR